MQSHWGKRDIPWSQLTMQISGVDHGHQKRSAESVEIPAGKTEMSRYEGVFRLIGGIISGKQHTVPRTRYLWSDPVRF
jgi:hypothetical protein